MNTDEVTPRAVIASAVHGEYTITADTPADAWADDALAALDRAGFAVVANVWVAQLELIDGQGGWVSVHTTAEGAIETLIGWARGVGIELTTYTTDSGSTVLDDHPDVETHGISYVPVQR